MKALPKFIEDSEICKTLTSGSYPQNMISSNYVNPRQFVKNRMRIVRILKNRNKIKRKIQID